MKSTYEVQHSKKDLLSTPSEYEKLLEILSLQPFYFSTDS